MQTLREGSAGRCVLHGDTKARVKCTAGVHGAMYSNCPASMGRRAEQLLLPSFERQSAPELCSATTMQQLAASHAAALLLLSLFEAEVGAALTRPERCVRACHACASRFPNVACLRQAHQPSTSLDLVELHMQDGLARVLHVANGNGAAAWSVSRPERGRTALRRAWPI